MSRAEAKARTRDALLSSARRVFAEKGFHAATVEEIAAGAGFTRGAFYANFADKSEAFWAVAEAEDAALFAYLEPSLEQEDARSALDVVDSWFEALLHDQPLQQAFAEIGSLAADGPDRARLAALNAANRARIAVVLRSQSEERGVALAAPPEDLAAIFLGLVDGLRAQHRLDPSAVRTTLITDGFVYLWLGAAAVAADPDQLSRGT